MWDTAMRGRPRRRSRRRVSAGGEHVTGGEHVVLGRRRVVDGGGHRKVSPQGTTRGRGPAWRRTRLFGDEQVEGAVRRRGLDRPDGFVASNSSAAVLVDAGLEHGGCCSRSSIWLPSSPGAVLDQLDEQPVGRGGADADDPGRRAVCTEDMRMPRARYRRRWLHVSVVAGRSPGGHGVRPACWGRVEGGGVIDEIEPGAPGLLPCRAERRAPAPGARRVLGDDLGERRPRLSRRDPEAEGRVEVVASARNRWR